MPFRGFHVIDEKIDVAATAESGDEIVIAQHDRTGEVSHGIDDLPKGTIVCGRTNLRLTVVMARQFRRTREWLARVSSQPAAIPLQNGNPTLPATIATKM